MISNKWSLFYRSSLYIVFIMIGLMARISYEFFLESHCWVHQDFLACSVRCPFAFCSLGQVWSGRSIGRFCLLEYWSPRWCGIRLGCGMGSTGLSWRGWSRRGLRRLRRLPVRLSCVGCHWT